MVYILVNLTVSDERRENRFKAVYLLGQIGYFLGDIKEHADFMFWISKSLASILLNLQMEERMNVIEPIYDNYIYNLNRINLMDWINNS